MDYLQVSPEMFTPLQPDPEDDTLSTIQDSEGVTTRSRLASTSSSGSSVRLELPPPASTPAALRLLREEAAAFMRWPVRGRRGSEAPQ